MRGTLNVDLSVFKERFADQIDADISIGDYVDFDIELTTSHGKLTTADIIAEVTGAQEEDEKEEDDEGEDEDVIRKPTTEEVLKAISVLEDFSLFSSFEKAMMKSLKDLNHNVEKDVLCTRKQTFISDFFSKE